MRTHRMAVFGLALALMLWSCEQGDEGIVNTVVAHLSDSDPGVRAAAWEAMWAIVHHDRIMEAVTETLEHHSKDVRLSAVEGWLCKPIVADGQSVRALAACIADHDYWVRRNAIEMVEKILLEAVQKPPSWDAGQVLEVRRLFSRMKEASRPELYERFAEKLVDMSSGDYGDVVELILASAAALTREESAHVDSLDRP